ncbi:MAG: V-type ATP synthase subunit D [Intestinibacter sp.]
MEAFSDAMQPLLRLAEVKKVLASCTRDRKDRRRVNALENVLPNYIETIKYIFMNLKKMRELLDL